MRTALQGAESDIDFEQLVGVFDSAQQAMEATSSVSPQADQPLTVPDQKPARRPDGREGLTAEEFALRIAELEQGATEKFCLDDLSVSEEQLSILLQMLPVASNEALSTALAGRLRQVVIQDQDHAARLCHEALTELAEQLPFETFDLAFRTINGILRMDVETLLVERLARIARTCSERAQEALWPHVADEVLRYRSGQQPELGPEPLRFLDELPQHALSRAVARLCKLPALAQNELAEGSFDVRQVRCYRLFAQLVVSRRSALVGPAIMAGLQSLVIEIDGAACLLKALPRYRPEYAEFLHHLLLDLPKGKASEALQSYTSTLLTRALRRLASERRKELWVTQAIAYLGSNCSPGARSVLENITKHRKWIGIHAWPGACRKEAKLALELLEQNEDPHDC